MRDLTVRQLHALVGGRLRLATLPPREGEHARLGRLTTDSRDAGTGDTFWALRGSRFDGGQFAEQAYEQGAAGVVAQRYIQPAPSGWSLQVDDTLESLSRLARWNRDRFNGRLVAVTGSVGKTTARQMISAVLSESGQGTASPKNYNNHFGVPLSMLAIEPHHDFAVLEIAASSSGEIDRLAHLAAPQIGVITRIGEAHLEGFGSLESLARAKAELLARLPADGWAVLPGDDPWLRRLAADCKANIVWVGRSLDCDLIATGVHCGQGQLSFQVEGHSMRAPVWGRHHLNSALSAVAVGRIFGLSMPEIAHGLASFQPPAMRCQISEIAGATIINDTYNASPAAMRAALELLRDFDAPGRRIVVCGDMRELGDASQQLHRQLGDDVVTVCGADLLVACGDHAQDVVAGACEAGMPAAHTVACQAPEETLSHLGASLSPGDVVLVKGSRALAMERFVEALEAGAPSRAA